MADITTDFIHFLIFLLFPLMNPGVVKHHQRSCKICHFYTKQWCETSPPCNKIIIIIFIIKIIWLLLIIFITIITIINITQFKILNSVIHWCQATTGCLRKLNKILSILTELISANFCMRLIDVFTLTCFKLPFRCNGFLPNATTTTGYDSRLTANILIILILIIIIIIAFVIVIVILIFNLLNNLGCKRYISLLGDVKYRQRSQLWKVLWWINVRHFVLFTVYFLSAFH